MHTSNQCLNCQALLDAGHQFCPGCGQATQTHRLSTQHIFHDLLHAFTHADKGILHLLKQLILRPGKVAREYVAGKRKTYFNPFSFLVLVVGLSSVIIISTNFASFAGVTQQPNPVSNFFNKHVNVLIFMNVPVLAFFNWLLFKKQGKNFAENLVLAAYTSGERSVFFTVVVAPLWMLVQNYYPVFLGIYIFSWFSYFAWATMQFFEGRKLVLFLKGFLSAFLTQLVSIIVVTLVYFVYFSFKR